MFVAAVVVAGGQGVRFGGLKQFAILENETVAARSVRMARSVASKVILVVPASYDGDGDGADEVVIGGDTRSQSVRNGLARCADADVVVIHDAARPLASAELFTKVVSALSNDTDGAIPGLKVTDTVKRVRTENSVMISAETLDRENLVTVQTPQAFRVPALLRAHEGAHDATDDAALVEASGGKVVVVEGEVDNVKITNPGDLEKMASVLRRDA